MVNYHKFAAPYFLSCSIFPVNQMCDLQDGRHQDNRQSDHFSSSFERKDFLAFAFSRNFWLRYAIVLLIVMLRLFCSGLQQTCSASCVMLPEQNLLIVYEFCALRIHHFTPEMFVLQQIQEIQTHRVLEVLCIFGLFPVEQILQVVDECQVFEVTSLSQNCAEKYCFLLFRF